MNRLADPRDALARSLVYSTLIVDACAVAPRHSSRKLSAPPHDPVTAAACTIVSRS